MGHGRKMAAPIIIAVLLAVYYMGIAALFLTVEEIPAVVKFLITAVSLMLTGVAVGVLVSRIKEIRSGEEDDLSQY